MDFFYRFRSTNALLDGHNELDSQIIYFASPEQLNDPMEGFNDVFWSGDKIVWTNLFRHYLLCLLQNIYLVIIAQDDYSKDMSRNLIFHTKATLPQAPIRDLYEGICSYFFLTVGFWRSPISCQITNIGFAVKSYISI